MSADKKNEEGSGTRQDPQGEDVSQGRGDDNNLYSIDKLVAEARRIAREYRKLTGNSLGGITSEIAVHDAVRLLQLQAVEDKSATYDALGEERGQVVRYQIKGRTIYDEARSNPRLGQLKLKQAWDKVLLVLYNEDLFPYEIYEASREEITEVMQDVDENSKRRKRGLMSVAQFKIIGQLIWLKDTGKVDGEAGDNPSLK